MPIRELEKPDFGKGSRRELASKNRPRGKDAREIRGKDS